MNKKYFIEKNIKKYKSKIFKIINMVLWCNGEHTGL